MDTLGYLPLDIYALDIYTVDIYTVDIYTTGAEVSRMRLTGGDN